LKNWTTQFLNTTYVKSIHWYPSWAGATQYANAGFFSKTTSNNSFADVKALLLNGPSILIVNTTLPNVFSGGRRIARAVALSPLFVARIIEGSEALQLILQAICGSPSKSAWI
jgi:hypothetical protein